MTDGQRDALRSSEQHDESADSFSPVPGLSSHIPMDRATVERGLVTLVLTVVEFLRQLMERQAIRRVDQGDLTDATDLILAKSSPSQCLTSTTQNLLPSVSSRTTNAGSAG